MKLSRPASPRAWADLFIELMDLVALLAVFSTGETQSPVWIAVLAMVAMRIHPALRIGQKPLLGFFTLLFLGAIQFYLEARVHPIVVAVHLLPLIHASLWLAKPAGRYRGWRIGVGFVELIVAAALTPDLPLPFLVFAFVVLGAVALSCSFLDQELRRRAPILVEQDLPPKFIQRGVLQAMTVLLTSALIFPFLPRLSGSMGGLGGRDSQQGYTEQVDLSSWTRFSEAGAGAIALRIFSPDERDVAAMIPFGLLRTRVLPLYDGRTWNAPPRESLAQRSRSRAKRGETAVNRISILREKIGSPSLPVPYGTREVVVDLAGYAWNLQPATTEEWSTDRRADQRTRYTVVAGRDALPEDKPTATHLAVPPAFRQSRIELLATNLFRTARTDREKILAVRGFFRNQDFKPGLPTGEPVQGTNPLEEFLFKRREGHCELFSGATALLLRMGGVPTRLVAGFRVTRFPVGNVLTVRMSDAHAWVEAYRPETGWMPLDFTPRTLDTSMVTALFRDGYDWMSAQWYRYVVTYDESALTLLDMRRWKNRLFPKSSGPAEERFSIQGDWAIFVGVLLGGSLLAALLATRRIWKNRRQRLLHEGPRALRQERIAFERARARTPRETAELAKIRDEWDAHYASLRFGPPTADLEGELTRLRELRSRYQRPVSEAKPS